jgi:hypothetical protein
MLPLAACLIGITASTAWTAELSAGGYSFSDELGGFRLLSATGAGTPADPIVVVEEFAEAAPATLVIRRLAPRSDPRLPSYQPLTLEKVVVNRSRRVWAGFEVELQEVLKQPSEYGDGLSFNQYGAAPPDVASDAFGENERLFEPYDRIRFQSGHVDPETTARFRLTITDPTPIREFYLVQDPKLLSAGLPASPSLASTPVRRSSDPPGSIAAAMSP